MIEWTPKLLTAILIERINREAREEIAATQGQRAASEVAERYRRREDSAATKRRKRQ